MGTLERIRQTSPYALAIFAIIFIGFFVVSDLDPGSFMGRGNNPQTAPIAIVNGESILYKDFNKKVQEVIDQQRKSQKNEAEIDENQIRKDVFREMIDQTILKQEAEKAGIFVSVEEIRDIMMENPPDFLKKNFIDTAGVFMKDVYLDIITNPDRLRNYLASQMTPEQIQEQINNFRNDLVMIENFLREQKLAESLTNLVNSTQTILSPSFVEEKYLAENATTGVNYIFFDVNSIPDNEIKITQDELKELYNEQKQYYEQDPMVKIKYVIFPIIPSQDDTIRAGKRIEKIEKALQNVSDVQQRDSIFDVNMSEYGGITSDYTMIADLDQEIASILDTLEKLQVVGPIQTKNGVSFFRLDDKRSGENVIVKASHILIQFDNNKDSAKKEALSILKEAKSGKDFAELARKYSKDPGSAQKGGDLGYFGKGRMVKEFEDACFKANPGEIVGPVETQFGYHIIKVFEKKTDEIKYSEISIKPNISNVTTTKIFRDAYSLQNQANEGIPFDTLIKRLKLVPNETPFVTKNQPLLGSEYLTHLVFENPVGTVLEPIELKQYGIVVAQILDSRPAGVASYQDLEQSLREILVHRKKLDKALKKAEEFYKRIAGIKELTDLSQIDSSLKVQTVQDYNQSMNIPNVGVDPVFANNVFKLPTRKINKPFKGSRGAYIVQIFNRNIPNLKAKKAEIYTYKTQLQRNLRQRAFYSWFNYVKKNAVIEDLRYKFFTDY